LAVKAVCHCENNDSGSGESEEDKLKRKADASRRAYIREMKRPCK